MADDERLSFLKFFPIFYYRILSELQIFATVLQSYVIKLTNNPPWNFPADFVSSRGRKNGGPNALGIEKNIPIRSAKAKNESRKYEKTD